VLQAAAAAGDIRLQAAAEVQVVAVAAEQAQPAAPETRHLQIQAKDQTGALHKAQIIPALLAVAVAVEPVQLGQHHQPITEEMEVLALHHL
jgi:hypothetical protein